MEHRTVNTSVNIKAPVSVVWKAITDPVTIKKWFFGTDVSTDWKEGSPVIYSGTWQGKTYKDKGEIKKVQKEKLLSHTYWSSISGDADKPENYYTVIYELEPAGNETKLSITQQRLMSEETAAHSTKNWEMVFQKLKELLEADK